MKQWVSVLAAALIVAASSGGASAASDDLVIGFSTSTTGPYIGNSATNQIAVGLAVDEINAAGGVNGHKLRVVQFDTAGNPQQAQVALRQFADDDHALAVVGPFSSGECRVAFAAGERIKIVQISNAASSPGITKGFTYAFTETSDEFTQFHRLLLAMKEKKLPVKTADIAYASDEFISKSLGEGIFPTVFKQDGIPVGTTVSFPLAAFDLSPQVAQLAQHPADVTAVGATIEAVVKLVHEMRRQGDKSRIVGSGVIADPLIAQKMGPDGEGLLYPTYFFPTLNAKTKAFSAKFATIAKKMGFSRTVPMHNDASAYDTVHLIAEAMKRAHVTGDPAKVAQERTAIRDQLAGDKAWNFTGLLGRTYFDAAGAAHMPTYVVEIHNGKLELFDTVLGTQ